MKKLTAIIIAAALMGSCKKGEELKYATRDNIFLNFDDAKTKDRDSLIFTFAYTPAEVRDTVFIPVSISGNRKHTARKYKVQIVADSTTAKAGQHYEALKAEYIMPADSGKSSFPIIIYNTDPDLSKRSVLITFRLAATDDLGVNIINIIRGKLVISNKLEQPKWWGSNNDQWAIGSSAGSYSQVKHELWLTVTGIRDFPWVGTDAPKYLFYNGTFNKFLSDPQSWIMSHPERGYKLDFRPIDGNYDFYNIDNPSRKILFRKKEQTGKFYFVDENNQDIV